MQSMVSGGAMSGRSARVDARYILKRDATFESGSLSMRCQTIDISTGGVCIALWGTDALKMGSTALITIKGLPPLKGTVRWKKSDSFGLFFDDRSASKPEVRALLSQLADEGKLAP